jgi:endonuclease/exonuclease/phosphatase family metal-dependent hydrolase
MTLRVMTWNLWWHFGRWGERFPIIVDAMKAAAPDVICLQEVWSNRARSDAQRLAVELDFHVVETDPVFYDHQSFGNALLARWPLTRIADEVLPRADSTPSHRRIVAATIDSPWGPWPIASTHLEHRFDRSADRVAQVTRMMELGARWRGNATSDLPLIVGADLNAVPDSDEVRMATGRSPGIDGFVFSDAWEQSGEGPGETWLRANPHTGDSAWPDRRLDYLLVSWPRPKPIGNPVRAWRTGDAPVGGRWPSDHCAVVADFVTASPAEATEP